MQSQVTGEWQISRGPLLDPNLIWEGFLGQGKMVEDPNRLHNTSGAFLSCQPLHTQQNLLLTRDLYSSTSESQQYFSGCSPQSSVSFELLFQSYSA